MTRFYFVRHGTTDSNVKGIYYGRTDSALNGRGILQAKDLCQTFSLVDFDEIYTSPMKRCRDTVEIITTKKEIRVEEKLVEMDFGLWEGMHYTECMKIYPKEYENWCSDYKKYTPPNGEKYTDFYDRIYHFYHNVLKELQGNILIVSHKGVLQLLMSLLLNEDDSLFWNFDFMPGKYSILEKELNHCTVKNLNI